MENAVTVIRLARPLQGESLDSATAPELRGECPRVALILQGGGALGAYQGGVYEALAAGGYLPDWVAGISIGAINAALIVGNPPERRIERLSEFWRRITRDSGWLPKAALAQDSVRRWLHAVAAAGAAAMGVPGFFQPRLVPPLLASPGTPGALSYYDTDALRTTLEELVDFDLINSGPVRLSVGAVQVTTGNFVYFDNKERRLGPEHIMASGALPPGFPPIEVDGELYWDGGIVSNTPLAAVLENADGISTLCFAVDLYPSRGPLPQNMADVEQRHKDIQYSSRSRLNIAAYRTYYDQNARMLTLLARLPAQARHDPEVARIAASAGAGRMHVANLIYRAGTHELESKDYEFSRLTMLEHWHNGARDTTAGIAGEPGWRHSLPQGQGLATYDLTALVMHTPGEAAQQVIVPKATPAGKS